MNFRQYKRKSEKLESILNALANSVLKEASPTMFNGYDIEEMEKREIISNAKSEIWEELNERNKV